MKKRFLLALCIYLFLISLGCTGKNNTKPDSIQLIRTDTGISVQEDNKPVLFYQTVLNSLNGEYPRTDYIHPLYNLKGEIITEDFPEDHLHHRGIFWAWHQVWLGSKRLGDSWFCKDVSWQVADVQLLGGPESSKVKSTVLWVSPNYTDSTGTEIPFIKEVFTITIYPAAPNYRIIDCEGEFNALADSVKLGGSEDEKGYGGFSPRFKLPQDVQFMDENGAVTPQLLQVAAGPWMDLSGTYDTGISGVTIFCHPGNPGYPQKWILRDKKSMQNPVYPGREPVVIPVSSPLILRYRLVLHNGDVNAVDLGKLFKKYRVKFSH